MIKSSANNANLHKIAFKAKAASANITAAEGYLADLKALIHEGGYIPKHVFNVDETELFWKSLTFKGTFICKSNKS